MQEQQTKQLYESLNSFITEIENSDEAIFQFTSLTKEEFQLELIKLLRGLIKITMDTLETYNNNLTASGVFTSVLSTVKKVYGEEVYQRIFSKGTSDYLENNSHLNFSKMVVENLDKSDSVKYDRFIEELKQKRTEFLESFFIIDNEELNKQLKNEVVNI
jgi:hypothetical protein